MNAKTVFVVFQGGEVVWAGAGEDGIGHAVADFTIACDYKDVRIQEWYDEDLLHTWRLNRFGDWVEL